MGTISDKTTYLNTTKTKIREKINDLGQDLDEEDTFRSYAEALEQVWNEYPKVTATDVEEATLNGTKKGRMEIDLKGQESQDTYTGKNKLAYTLQTLKTKNTLGTWNENVYTYNGVTYTVNDDLTILVNGTSQTSSYFVLTTLDSNMLNVGTEYILNGCPTGGDVQKYSLRMYDGSSYVTQSGNDLTFTYGTQGNVRINVFGGSTATNQLFKPMIRLSSVADNSYEPYCGGIPSPNPDFPQPIKNVTGQANIKIQNKNLFTSEWVQGEINSTTGIIGPSNTSIATDNFIEVKPNTRYSMSRTIATAYMNVRGYDENKNYIGTGNSGKVITTIIGSSNANPMQANEDFCVIEIKENIHYLKFNDLSNDLSTKYMMVEGQYTAETIPDYVPHQEQNYPFTFAEGQRAMQGTTLQDDGIHNIRKQRVLNGTEFWSVLSRNNGYQFETTNTLAKRGDNSKVEILSNYFTGIKFNDRDTQSESIYSYVGDNDIRILTNVATNVDDFKQWLSTHNVTVEFILAEEEIIPYNATQQAQYNAIKQVRSYDDQTNISSTSDELAFKMDVEILSNGVSSSNTRTLALGSLNQGSLNNIKEVDTEDTEVAQDAEDETSVESEE